MHTDKINPVSDGGGGGGGVVFGGLLGAAADFREEFM